MPQRLLFFFAKPLLGLLAIILPIATFAVLIFYPQAFSNSSPAPAGWQNELMAQNWQFYKTAHMENEERVRSNNYQGTISEGQSYALARALYHNDPKTFNKVYRWTLLHMARPHDTLLGWKWGQKPDGSWGLLETENASDADQDIAYYLLQAGKLWKRADYNRHALAMINDLWRLNVVGLKELSITPQTGKPLIRYYLNPGTWEGFSSQGLLTLDPSYFSANIYRAFAKVDSVHPWEKLADNVIPTLEACSDLTVTKLPPNWCGVRYDTHQIVFSDIQGPGSRDFSWDAHRVFWRTAVDAQQGSASAKVWLHTHTFLLNYWQQHHQLPEVFTWTGEVRNDPNSAFTLSAALAQNHVVNPGTDLSFYKTTLKPLYHTAGPLPLGQSGAYWQTPANDFMQSVVWFGLRATVRAQ